MAAFRYLKESELWVNIENISAMYVIDNEYVLDMKHGHAKRLIITKNDYEKLSKILETQFD